MLLILRSSIVFISFGFLLLCCTALTIPKTSPSSESSVGKLGKPSGSAALAYITNKRYQRSVYGVGPKMLTISHSKIPIELDLVVDDIDDDGDGRPKRYDDYGHMRFGKRGGGKFDDYGHMRFGRSL